MPKHCLSSETGICIIRNTPVCRLFALIEVLPLKLGTNPESPKPPRGKTDSHRGSGTRVFQAPDAQRLVPARSGRKLLPSPSKALFETEMCLARVFLPFGATLRGVILLYTAKTRDHQTGRRARYVIKHKFMVFHEKL